MLFASWRAYIHESACGLAFLVPARKIAAGTRGSDEAGARWIKGKRAALLIAELTIIRERIRIHARAL